MFVNVTVAHVHDNIKLELLVKIVLKKYDTNINIIGSIKDIGVIRKSFEAFFTEKDSIDSLLVERNEFVYNTYKTTTRISSGIESAFIKFNNEEHFNLYRTLFTNNYPIELLNYAIFLQFAVSNHLFLDITKNVFIKNLLAGRIGIKTEDIYSYLIDAIETKQIDNISWSDSTIKIITTKYLNFMSKLGFVDEKSKEFKYININTACFYLLLNISNYCTESNNFLNSPLLPLSFMTKDNIINQSKYLGQKEFIDVSYNGESLNIMLKDNTKEVLDALSK